MQTLSSFLALLGLAAIASGCAAAAALPISSMVGSPNTAALEVHNQTEVRLQEANFVVSRTNVVGQCKGFSLFGFITLVPARFTTAMNRLYSGAEMQPGKAQTLAHLIVEKNSTYFILFSLPRVSVRADVVEFMPKSAILLPPTGPTSPMLPMPEEKDTSDTALRKD